MSSARFVGREGNFSFAVIPLFMLMGEFIGPRTRPTASIWRSIATPPFGLLVFTVKVAIRDADVSIASIFRGAAPYWLIILGTVFLISEVPIIATWLPSLQF